MVLACGAFGQRASVVFTGLGRQQLRAGQHPPKEERNIEKILSSLPLYDIENVFLLKEPEDSEERETFSSPRNYPEGLAVTEIQVDDFRRLIASADHVLSF